MATSAEGTGRAKSAAYLKFATATENQSAWEKYAEFDEPCHWVASKGEMEPLKDFLYARSGAPHIEVGCRDRAGRTPLHRAAVWGHTDVVPLFKDLRADFDAPDNIGWTTLFYASACGHPEIANTLIECGGKATPVDMAGSTALHMAATNGHPALIESLLAANADPNVVDKAGRTALHRAAVPTRFNPALMAKLEMPEYDVDKVTECIKLLLAAGADATIEDANGKTAADVAIDDDLVDALGGPSEEAEAAAPAAGKAAPAKKK